jgi:hypothetical protein
LTALLFCYVVFVEFMNPHVTGFLNSRMFETWTTNIEYVKFKKIGEVNKIETVIIGSSTSEAFHPVDINQIYNTQSYVLSLGGADTPTRSVFFKQSVEKFSKLKRIIYVADFFEFNKEEAKPEVAFNLEMSQKLSDFAKPSPLKFVRYYFNHQILEDAFNVVNRKRKNKKIEINEDGSATRSMVLSTIQARSGFESLISDNEKEKLLDYVEENFVTYSSDVLNNFEILNPKVINLYNELLELAKNKNLEIIFVLSPYQYDFREKLKSIKNFKKLYSEWQNFFGNLAKNQKIKVINATNEFISTEPMSGVWRDGIHYSRAAALTLLEKGM